ncbi:MAG: substrate-binding domain-containing protein [Faecalibacterium sp.]
MKRYLCAIALLLCLLPCSACAFSQQPYTITLIPKGSLSVDFWQSVYDGAQAAADVYGVNLVLETPSTEDNYQEQIDLLLGAAESGSDAIVLAASDYTLLAEPVQQVIDAGVPVVMVDSDVDNANTVAYVGTDNEAMGQLLAESLCEYVTQSGDVAIISFVQDSQSAMLREQGFRSVMENDSRFTLLDTAYCNSDATEAMALTVALLMENTDIVAIAALNDPSIEGVCAALAYFPEREIQVFSIDCTPKQVPYIEDGTIDVSVLQNPYQMGYLAVERAYQYLEGETTQENIYTDIYAADISLIYEDLYQQLIFPFE